MRLHPGTALVVYLCLWIPVAHANEAPEDQDASGDDDEFSASGSGDGDIWFDEPVKTTQASPNTTEAVWFTTAPDTLLEDSTITPIIVLDNEPETSGHITEAFLPTTTAITETEPTSVRMFGINPLGEEGEATTVSNEEQPETTQPPAEEPPVVPTSEKEYTTAFSDEEPTTKPLDIFPSSEEEETTAYEEPEPVATEAPDMETTPLVLSTTSDSNLADAEASGDTTAESTAVESNSIEETISEKRKPVVSKDPTLQSDIDFHLDNEIQPRSQPGSGSESEYALGNSSDNDSLLERKEVLAGVIAGGVVGLAFAIMLVSLMVYRMKKKDEGSYSLDEQKHPNGGYQKPQKQEEFLA